MEKSDKKNNHRFNCRKIMEYADNIISSIQVSLIPICIGLFIGVVLLFFIRVQDSLKIITRQLECKSIIFVSDDIFKRYHCDGKNNCNEAYHVNRYIITIEETYRDSVNGNNCQ